MEYKQYLEKIKDFAKKSSLKQRFFAGLVLIFLLGLYVVYIDPTKKLLERRNSQRRSDVVNILNAVYQYRIDKNEQMPENIDSAPKMICKSGAESCEGLVDISEVLIIEKKILSRVPIDPKENNSNSSGYQISLLANGRLNVTAPLAENGAIISLSK